MRPSQQREFVSAIRGGATVTVACQRAVVSRGWVYRFAARVEGTRFRLAWAEARAVAARAEAATERRRVEAEQLRDVG